MCMFIAKKALKGLMLLILLMCVCLLLFVLGVFNLTNTTYEAESIHVEWYDTGSSSYCGGNESLYYLFMVSFHRRVVLSRISHDCPSLEHRGVRCSEIFTGLKDNTNYTIKIFAVNRAGIGANEAINVMTAASSGNIIRFYVYKCNCTCEWFNCMVESKQASARLRYFNRAFTLIEESAKT